MGNALKSSLAELKTAGDSTQYSLTERICNNGVIRVNDISENFEEVTIVNKSEFGDESNFDKIRNDRDDFTELENILED